MTRDEIDRLQKQVQALQADLKRVTEEDDWPPDWWDKGYDARKAGQPRGANPYPSDSYGVTTSHNLWDWGWLTYDALEQVETLQAELASVTLENAKAFSETIPLLSAKAEDAETELERLRTLNQGLRGDVEQAREAADTMLSLVAPIRAALDAARAVLPDTDVD